MLTSQRSGSGRTFERTNDDMKDKNGTRAVFRGYAGPNYTPVPDELFDEQLPDLSGAELKVLLYVIRRTFGFKRESDNISLSQMLNGLRTRDGRVLDRGVGLSKKTLLQAIKSLEKQNIVLTQRRRSQEKSLVGTNQHVIVCTCVHPPYIHRVRRCGGRDALSPSKRCGRTYPEKSRVVGQNAACSTRELRQDWG